MGPVRSPAVAGSFYPKEPQALLDAVHGYLASAEGGDHGEPKALIVPHAGYVYSGPIAGSAYAQVAPLRGRIERVLLLGPAHRVFLRGLAVPSADEFETPLGRVTLDREAIERALEFPQVVRNDEPHALEHSLEVHLPFLQVTLGDFSLVPLVVGDATPEEVAAVLCSLWGGPSTLIVVSSDLSHYYEYATARRLDAATSLAIEELRPEAIDEEGACGRIPVQGLLLAAREHGLHAKAVDVRNSGDTAGSRDRVVGYGAYVVT